MAKYYPKSQIIPNLYATNGNSNKIKGTLVNIKTKDPHTGFFWATADGKYFTGKTPSDLPNIELIIDNSDSVSSTFDPLNPISKTKSTLALFLNDPEAEIRGLAGPTPKGNPDYGWSQYNVVSYAKLRGISLNDPPELDNPYTNPIIPKEVDYKRGSFRRYFAKKRNANIYIETDKQMYDAIKGKKASVTYYDYLAFDIIWVITGDKDVVEKTNLNSINLTSRIHNISGFDKFLKSNYLEYYGLYTEGGEYKLPNGKVYVGLYHIHPDKGPMVGRVHVPTPHDKLVPINQSIAPTSSISPLQSPQSVTPATSQPLPTTGGGGGYSSGY